MAKKTALGTNSDGKAESPEDDLDEQPPPEEPTTEPTPAEGAPPAEGTVPEATPTEEPPPPAEPAGFTLGFDSDVVSDAAPCECIGPSSVTSESISFSDNQVVSYDQTLDGSGAASGRQIYGLHLRHWAQGPNHYVDFVLNTPEGTYMYSGRGAVMERSATEWGGSATVYAGTYSLGSRPSMSERVPESGSYRVELTSSYKTRRIVSASFFLTGGEN